MEALNYACPFSWVQFISKELKAANPNSKGDVSFLLTHYHEDHYYGFYNMISKDDNPLQFKHIYIPNVWDEGDGKLVALLLLSELRSKPEVGIVDFLLALLNTDGICHFVECNTIIENRYKAIWPKKDFIRNSAEDDFEELFGKNSQQELLRISDALIQVVSSLNNESFKSISPENLDKIKKIKDDLDKCRNDSEYKKIKKINLPSYGNRVSIVFQTDNKRDIPKILFTGDFPREYWKEINKELHEKYDVIKVPHHGTEGYYWDKLKDYLSDTSIELIPNGNINNSNWFICFKYPHDLNNPVGRKGYHIYCSNNNSCTTALGNGGKCVCINDSGCISSLPGGKEYMEFTI